MQECIDVCVAQAEKEERPLWNMRVPDDILSKIGCDGDEYKTLSIHFQMFGEYLIARMFPLELKQTQDEGWIKDLIANNQAVISIFNNQWKDFYQSRWPQQLESEVNLMNIYWQSHIQECIDVCVARAEKDKRPLRSVQVPENILSKMGCNGDEYKTLSIHFQMFGQYAKKLVLPQAFIHDVKCARLLLLQEDHFEELQLQKMEFNSVDMDGMVVLLSKNRVTLKKLCFDGGELDEAFLKKVYTSLSFAMRRHGLENLVLRDVRLRRKNKKEFPRGLTDLIKWGRSLNSLSLSGLGFQKEEACFIFQTICDDSLPITELDLSRNSLSGFLQAYQKQCREKAVKGKKGSSYKLQLRALNLRESCLSANDLECLACDLDDLLPCLEQIDIRVLTRWPLTAAFE